MDRQADHGMDALPQLLKRIGGCRLCVESPRGRPLPHEPRPVLRASVTARLCVSSQAPGTRVHATGLPFNDPSGDRLRSWMAVDRDTFYDASRVAIVPMGFCFPGLDAKGGDLPPRPECRATWHDQVYATLPNLRFLLAIGGYAHRYHLGSEAAGGVTETVRRWREFIAEPIGPSGARVLPLPHPSWRNTGWLKRNPWFEDEVIPVLRAEVAAAIATGMPLSNETDDRRE